MVNFNSIFSHWFQAFVPVCNCLSFNYNSNHYLKDKAYNIHILFTNYYFSSELQTELEDKDKEYQDLMAHKKNIQSKLTSLEEEKYEMDNEVEKQRSSYNDKDREMDMLQKDYELAKEKEAVLMGDR